MPAISQFSPSYLHRVFSYDPVSGALERHSKRPTDEAGTINRKGYRMVGIDRVYIPAHHIAWKMTFGEDPGGTLDHVNRVKSDNRITNIREVSHSESNMNKNVQRNNRSGTTGVFWDPKTKKWLAYIQIARGRKHLGCFAAKADAVASRMGEEMALFGEFSPHHMREV